MPCCDRSQVVSLVTVNLSPSFVLAKSLFGPFVHLPDGHVLRES
jgi:hypothetical protein